MQILLVSENQAGSEPCGDQRLGMQTRNMSKLSLFVADPYPLFRSGLKVHIGARFPEWDIAEYGSYTELLAALKKLDQPGLVLVDPQLAGGGILAGLQHLHIEFPRIPIVVLSSSSNPAIARECLSLGAVGCLPKTANEEALIDAIQAAIDGDRCVLPTVNDTIPESKKITEIAAQLQSLTRQQMRVLLLMSQGRLNKQIAYNLGVGESTVKAHVTAILEKLAVATRTQAVIKLAAGGGNASLDETVTTSNGKLPRIERLHRVNGHQLQISNDTTTIWELGARWLA